MTRESLDGLLPAPPTMNDNTLPIRRCAWARNDLLIRYHDEEWGVPIHDDRVLFEFLVLEGAQAGLSWLTILKKRDAYRKAFDGFDPKTMARYSEKQVNQLLQNPEIIRNRLKIVSAVKNAQAVLAIQDECGSLDHYLWQFVGRRPKINSWRTSQTVPCSTPESDRMSTALRKRGLAFVGTTICYSFMQATGMVNDHTTDCFRYGELTRSPRRPTRGGS